MRYRLVVLTHGPDRTLSRALEAFGANVFPEPSSVVIKHDGPNRPWELGDGKFPRGWLRYGSEEQDGFCKATAKAMLYASTADEPWVFYLEHDFEITRPVDLTQIEQTMQANPQVCQMALMRDAVNDQEKQAGGLFESRAGQYTLKVSEIGWVWHEHTSYFTTNPSLMRTKFLRDNPWPADQPQCEGIFGFQVRSREPSTTFGVWGDGTPWCEHIGARDGFGY